MTDTYKEKAREIVTATLREIQDDCERDASDLDGKPFTGRVVAEQFGSTLAMLATVARAVEVLAERLDGELGEIRDGLVELGSDIRETRERFPERFA